MSDFWFGACVFAFVVGSAIVALAGATYMDRYDPRYLEAAVGCR